MNQISQIILRHIKPVIWFNVLVLVAAFFGIQNVKKTWTTRAQLILPSATTDLNANLGTLGNFKGGEGLIFTQQVDTRSTIVKILLSDKTLDSILQNDPEKLKFRDIDQFRKLFTIEPDPRSTTISLAVEAATSKLSQQRLEGLISSFQSQMAQLRQGDINERSRFLTEALIDAEKNLRQSEARLLEFQKKNQLAEGNSQTAELARVLNNLKSFYAEAKGREALSKGRVDALSRQLNETPKTAMQVIRLQANQVYQTNRRRLGEIETKLAEARSKFTEDHPLVIALSEERDNLLKLYPQQLGISLDQVNQLGLDSVQDIGSIIGKLSEQLVTAEGDVQAARQQAQELEKQLERLNSEFRRIPIAQIRLKDLQRQYNIAEGVYNGLIAQLKATKTDTFSSYPNVQVLDLPKTDGKPAGPGRRIVFLGALLTAFFGSAAIILFLENQNPLLPMEDLRGLEIPILGWIPKFPAQLSRRGATKQPLQVLVLSVQQWLVNLRAANRSQVPDNNRRLFDVANVEFRRAASAVSRLPLTKGRLMIASPMIGEGKTTVAFGLASALADLGFRVLLVDADLDNRGLSQQLGYGKSGKVNWATFPAQISTQLDFFPLDIEAPLLGRFVAQAEFQHILDPLQEKHGYDYVLIDVAPILLNSEMPLLLAMIPQVLLVLRPGYSHRKPFVRSLDQLSQSGALIEGFILNAVDEVIPERTPSELESSGVTIAV